MGCGVRIISFDVRGVVIMFDEFKPTILFNPTDVACPLAERVKLLLIENDSHEVTKLSEDWATGSLIVRVVAVILDGIGSPAGIVVSTPSATIEMELFDIAGSINERVGAVRYNEGVVLPEIEIEPFPIEKSLLSEGAVTGPLIERVVAVRLDGSGSPTEILVSTPSAIIVMKLLDSTESLVDEDNKPLLICIAIP